MLHSAMATCPTYFLCLRPAPSELRKARCWLLSQSVKSWETAAKTLEQHVQPTPFPLSPHGALLGETVLPTVGSATDGCSPGH